VKEERTAVGGLVNICYMGVRVKNYKYQYVLGLAS